MASSALRRTNVVQVSIMIGSVEVRSGDLVLGGDEGLSWPPRRR